MKRMKQLLALILSVIMLFTMVGCSNTSGDDKTTSSQTTQAPDSGETTTEESTTEEVVDLTYPLDTDITLTVWDTNFVKPNEEYSSYKESPFHTGLAENTGVEINWTYPVAGADLNEAWNLLLTEKELPDIIFRFWSVTEAEQLIEDGAIYDLTEYLPKYAPDYWETVNRPEYETSLKSMTTASGKQFCVGTFTEDTASVTYMGPVVRKDWLDACGLDIPETLADWEEMLVAFKEKYGITPLAMRKHQLINYDNIGSATGAYVSLNSAWALEDGKVIYANAQPEWKEYLTVMNRWYTDGYLDRDSVTMDNAAMRSKALNGEVGVSFVPLSQLTTWIADAEAENTGAEWIPISYPREAEGVATSMIQTRAAHWAGVGAAISTALSEEELILALKWLNYGYTEEGNKYWNYGEEGVSYNVVDGKVQFTEVVTNDVNGMNSGLTKYTGVSSNGMALQNLEFFYLKNGEVGANAVAVWTENTEAPSHIIPSIALTEDENLINKNLYAQISTYAKEEGLKFVTGERSLDEFDAFVEKLNSMGLQQCIKIQQGAYDRFMAK